MELSVVIVNYNVKAYLEQCLRTVEKAMVGVTGEVFVVDNQSTDGSVEMVREKFPWVRLIANADNVGFSRANNQAIREARGDYVLLLNPDTVVGEDVFRKVIDFMNAHPKAGGLGVKMIDGTGHFLPESKRGLPTPQVAFFKIIGLTRLFPKSRLFGRYHLGHLPENEAAPIEILSGACMFLRKRTLDEVGLLDESFFMYGEDIDLSYRITLGGYENWYYPDARIIHYKGESTKKSSVNYVFVFYNAMAIFAKKHFTARSAGIFPALINGSIYLSAAAALVRRFMERTFLLLLDLLLVFATLALSPVVPQRWPIIQEVGVDVVIGAVVVGWTALFGAYDRPLRPFAPVLAMVLPTLFLLGMRMFGPLEQEVTLDLLTMAGGWAVAATLLRAVLFQLRIKGMGIRRKERERVLAVGTPAEARRTLALLWQTHFGLGRAVSVEPDAPEAAVAPLRERIARERIGEVVFCAQDLGWSRIIRYLEQLRRRGTEFKIAQPGVSFIIGPSSIESLQDLFVLPAHSVKDPASQRNRRIVDLGVSLLVLLTFPLLAWSYAVPAQAARNAWAVLLGRRTWVGYATPLPTDRRLPGLPHAVLPPVPAEELPPPGLLRDRVNILYAKDQHLWHDLRTVFRSWRSLGNA
ncbi:MAG: glycosyltransferase family 2 protein [Flavobacteriales bacterium]